MIIVGLVMLFAPDPVKQIVLGMLQGGGGAVQQEPGKMGAPTDQSGDFLAAVLGSTEDVWNQEFQKGAFAHYGVRSGQYQPTTLVAFAGGVATGCGSASAAVGPFYCPADRKVYIDTSFFAELKNRFGAPGDFAQTYVIAHEVGHHLQTILGISDQIRAQQQAAGQKGANALQVRMELQADCFAGVWGRIAGDQKTKSGDVRLEPGDIDEALAAANAIGDDTLQKQARGTVVPDSFTHGSSEQRKRWFMIGYESADVAQCDTLQARQL
jgi:predicted metalloprotease